MVIIRCPSIIFLWKYTYIYACMYKGFIRWVRRQMIRLFLWNTWVYTWFVVGFVSWLDRLCSVKYFRGSLFVYCFIFHLFIVMSVTFQFTTFTPLVSLNFSHLSLSFLWEESEIDLMASVLYLHGFFEIKWKDIVL